MAGARPSDEGALVEALRRGDEAAFAQLVDELNGPLTRLALAHVPSRAVAEDVVGDTWLGVIRGIDDFEGRSSLRTWNRAGPTSLTYTLFSILPVRMRSVRAIPSFTLICVTAAARDAVRSAMWCCSRRIFPVLMSNRALTGPLPSAS